MCALVVQGNKSESERISELTGKCFAIMIAIESE